MDQGNTGGAGAQRFNPSAADSTLSARLRGHVQRLAGGIGERNVFHPEALHAAAAYIEATWSEQGYAVERQTYRVGSVESANLAVARGGSRQPQASVLLGAHYDSVYGSPGANDNASGVAALLELSRLLTTTTPALGVRCVSFVNEEPPFFFTSQQGSHHYAKVARERDEDIRLMIALETIGSYDDTAGSQHYPPLLRWFYPSRANFIAFVSNLRSRRLLERLTKAFREVSDFPVESAALPALVPGVAWSDHLAFWRQGYRALMVTDTAFYRYPWYHSTEDTPDKLDYARLAQVTEGLFQALLKLTETLSREVRRR